MRTVIPGLRLSVSPFTPHPDFLTNFLNTSVYILARYPEYINLLRIYTSIWPKRNSRWYVPYCFITSSWITFQEIPSLLEDKKFHYSVQKNPPLLRILCQMNPVPILYPIFAVHFNIINHSTPLFSKSLLLSDLPIRIMYVYFISHLLMSSYLI